MRCCYLCGCGGVRVSDIGALANQAADTLLSCYHRARTPDEREEVAIAIAKVQGDGARETLAEKERLYLEDDA